MLAPWFRMMILGPSFTTIFVPVGDAPPFSTLKVLLVRVIDPWVTEAVALIISLLPAVSSSKFV
jgi:hypothetical protein